MNAIILSVGDELVLGQTIDTNSAWISQQLAAAGCDIAGHITVPDDLRAIERAIRDSASRCDVLIVSGGIGPTEDDITRQALAAVMGTDLELNEQWLARLKEFFTRMGREMPKTNKIQAMIPRGATMIENTAGTAAGIRVTIDDRVVANAAVDELNSRVDSNPKSKIQNLKCEVFVMPGVPKEMKTMFVRDVLHHIKAKSAGAVILSRTLHTFGMGESSVAEKLGPLMNRTRNPSVGTTVSQGIVSLRINARFPSHDEAQQQLDDTTRACEQALGDLNFGRDDDTLAKVVAASLASSRKKVSTAESCTGGLLAKMLTDIPGSSEYFTQGWVTYSNQSKIDRLGIPQHLIGLYGVVSEPVVQAMARSAQRLAKSDYSLAISGIAGPSGGTPAKPAGTVCIALATPESKAKPAPSGACLPVSSVAGLPTAPGAGLPVFSRTFQFPGDREMIRDRAAKMALTILRFHLLDKPLPF